MNNSLDYSEEEFLQLIARTTEIIIEQYQHSDKQKGFHNLPQKSIEEWFTEPLPLSGIDSLQLLREVKEKIVDVATGNLGENMYAYVMAGGNQMSTIADFIASTINQNVTKWHLAPSMTEIEKRVIAWTSEMINYLPNAGGALVSGGSAAKPRRFDSGKKYFFQSIKN